MCRTENPIVTVINAVDRLVEAGKESVADSEV